MTKPDLIAMLTKIAENSGGDNEANHTKAEMALLEFVNDIEITKAWKEAAEFWWYA